MEGFLKIIKKKNLDINIKSILRLLEDYKNTNHYYDVKKTNEIIDIYYTNEYNNYPYHLNENEQFTPVGNFTVDKDKVKNALRNNDLKYLRNLQGSFALGYTDFNRSLVKLVTHISRIENIFYFEDEKNVIFGTDPFIVSVVSSEQMKPELDSRNFYTFLQNGYYVDDNTPFKGVRSLPPNKLVTVNDGVIRINDLDDSLDNIMNTPIDSIDLDLLTETFVNAFKTKSINNKLESLALTGGKDSRLIFAAMKHLNMDFSVFTNGFEENPDVLIASQIAKEYGYNHKINFPKISKDNDLNVNPYRRMLNSMVASSGLIYGYDSITLSNKGFQGDNTFDGVAAGLSKGGYSAFTNLENENKIVNTFNANDDLFLESNKSRFRESLLNIIGYGVDLEKINILSFLNFRTGRWTANAKLGKNYLKQQHSPFVDNLFLKKVLQISYHDSSNDRIIYEIMKRLDYNLTKISFAMDRWKFERFHPTKVQDFKQWIERQELYPKTYLGNYNWRQVQNNDKIIVSYFKDLLLSNNNSIIYQSLDYKKVTDIFSKKITSKENKLIWASASLIVYEHYIKNMDLILNKEKVKIKISGTKITKEENPPKTYNFSNRLESINDSLKKINNNYFELIHTKKNIYLNSMDGKMSEKPIFKKINNMKSITIGANITTSSKSDIRIVIITFDNSKRINQLTFYPREGENSNNFLWTETFKVKSNITHVRLLVNIRDKNVGNKYKVNYLYMKL